MRVEMSHHYITENGAIVGHVALPDFYRFKGFTFQVHNYCGPMKLKKDFSDAARTGRKFWKVWSEWDKLSEQEKEATRI